METVNNPDTSAEDLNNLISMDQGLASKVLRIVNSAYYGFPKRISTLYAGHRDPGLQHGA